MVRKGPHGPGRRYERRSLQWQHMAVVFVLKKDDDLEADALDVLSQQIGA